MTRFPAVVLTFLIACSATAGPELIDMSSDVRGPAMAAVPTPVPGIGGLTVMKEQFCYSSVVKRSYVPGYTPHASSRFENPRECPAALCVMATPYYQYGNIPGWFFASPRGYQTSVPPNSHALAYNRGELGLTDHLHRGYSEGLRVVEDVIVPHPAYCKSGGFFIDAGNPMIKLAQPVPLAGPGSQTETTTREQTITEQQSAPRPQLAK